MMQHKPLSLNPWNRRVLNLLSKKQRVVAVSHIVFSILLALAEVMSLAIVFPLFVKLIENSTSPVTLPFVGEKVETPWAVIVVSIVVIFTLKNAAAVWLTHRQLRFSNRLYLNFSERLYRNFFALDWVAYSHENSTEAFRKIKNTAFDFTSQVLSNYYLLITDLCICTLMTCVLLWIDYRVIFVLAVLSLPIGLFYLYLRKNIITKVDRSFRDLTPESNIILSQGIESFAEARIYKKEDYFINKFIAISSITTSQLATLKVFSIFPARLMETLGVALFGAVVAYVNLFPGQGQSLMVIGALFSLALYRIVPSLNRALQSLSQIQAYAYSVSELEETLSASNLQQREDVPVNFNREIVLKSVSFSYTASTTNFVLRDADAHIRKGEFILIEGPSGTGKTTFLHMLAGLIQGYTGEIRIDATPITPANLAAWQDKLAIVQQSPVVLQDTILNNICFGDSPERIDSARVENALVQAGLYNFVFSQPQQLHTPVGEHGVTLSGGQRQRLCLARALYRDPEILLLDEVTNQLDEENKVSILKMLESLSQKGKTIILSSHDPMVKRFASRVIHLDAGAIREGEALKQA